MNVMNLLRGGLAALLLTGVAGSLAAGPLPPLKAEGTRLADPQGRTVQLKGVNLGGWLLQETWMNPVKGSDDHWTTLDTLTKRFGSDRAAELIATFEDRWITAVDLEAIAKLGFNAVRLPFGYWNLQDDQGLWNRTASGAIDFGRLDWLVKEAGDRGLYVILDLHGAPGFASKEHSSGRVGASQLFAPGPAGEAFRQRTVDLWLEVAGHFAGNPAVAAYDLLNEPMAKPDDRTLWALYDRIYRAIRTVDAGHPISVEAVWEVGNLPDPKAYGWTNMLYQTHDYGWNLNQKSFIQGKIAGAALAWTYGVPLLVGEFNAFADPADWDNTLARYDEAGISWTFWTWKAKKAQSSWAVYANPFLTAPNPRTDSFEDIRAAWSEVATANPDFRRNEQLVASLSRSLARPAKAPAGTAPVAAAGPKGSRYEGEAAVIVGSTHHKAGIPAGTEQQGFFSGGLAVGGLNSSLKVDQVAPDWSNLPHVRFTVEAPAAGDYRVTLAYNGDDDKVILVRTNGGPGVPVPLPSVSGGAWNLMHQVVIPVTLTAGPNQIWVSGTLGGQGWENVDYIELTAK